MSNKPKFMRTAAERAVEVLVAHHSNAGNIPPEIFRVQASASGYSVRQLKRLVERRLADEPLWTEPAFTATEQIITAVFLACGCLAQAHRMLRKAGVRVPPETTFKRRVIETLGTAQLAYAKGGSKAFRDAQVYLASKYPHRMHSILLDHTELPIWVVPRGHKHAVKPWMTAVMDGKTRYLLSWTITYGRPTSEEVRAALMSAMTMRFAPDGETLVGGKPLRAVWDRGLEFLANLITESCLRLDVLPVALPAYSPHLKGQLERFWRFIKEDCLRPLPGYVEGPKDLRGNSAIAASALGEDEFLVKLADWVDWYTTEHRVNGKATPLEAWKADGTALNPVAPEQLWLDMLVAKDNCIISKNGIRFDSIDWTAPGMNGKVKLKVEIRYLPHDRTFIEVFRDGAHLFTATPQGSLTADEEQESIEERKRHRLEAQSRFTVANRQRKKNATGPVHRLRTDKDGNRHVIVPDDDLLDGGAAALAELVGESTAQQRMF
jgi:putative transposase